MSTQRHQIFMDGAVAEQAKELVALLGGLDGVTTNPAIYAALEEVVARIKAGEKFTEEELLNGYKLVVQAASELVTAKPGSVSVEVYADSTTTAKQMVEQALRMNFWIPNAHIKLPVTTEGIKAAIVLVFEHGVRVNMTLGFSQKQAAAVFCALRGAPPGMIVFSDFVGRLGDRGLNGMQLSENILRMFKEAAAKGLGEHVELITASVRSLDHLYRALQLSPHIITAPFKVLKPWGEAGMGVPEHYQYPGDVDLEPIPYEKLDLTQDWQSFDISHPQTESGQQDFADVWNKLLK